MPLNWGSFFSKQRCRCQIDKRRTFYDDKRDDRYQFRHLFIFDSLRRSLARWMLWWKEVESLLCFPRLFNDWWNEKFDTKLKRTWKYFESSQGTPIVSPWLISFTCGFNQLERQRNVEEKTCCGMCTLSESRFQIGGRIDGLCDNKSFLEKCSSCSSFLDGYSNDPPHCFHSPPPAGVEGIFNELHKSNWRRSRKK